MVFDALGVAFIRFVIISSFFLYYVVELTFLVHFPNISILGSISTNNRSANLFNKSLLARLPLPFISIHAVSLKFMTPEQALLQPPISD